MPNYCSVCGEEISGGKSGRGNKIALDVCPDCENEQPGGVCTPEPDQEELNNYDDFLRGRDYGDAGDVFDLSLEEWNEYPPADTEDSPPADDDPAEDEEPSWLRESEDDYLPFSFLL